MGTAGSKTQKHSNESIQYHLATEEKLNCKIFKANPYKMPVTKNSSWKGFNAEE